MPCRETKRIPESPQKQPKFKGDVACTNGRLGLVLRRQGTGAELYTLGEKGAALRAQLLPVAGKTPAQKLSAVKISRSWARSAAPPI